MKNPLTLFIWLYKKFLRTERNSWSIGMYVGRNPLEFHPAANVKNPVLRKEDVTDITARLVADPFIVREHQDWYMFFEAVNNTRKLGEIGLATSKDGFKWTYRQIVLSETFHLSYPYVFKAGDSYYMIPESHEANAIRLYRASSFPTEWSFVGNLLYGQPFTDSSIFFHGDKWWLFTSVGDELLLLFSCDINGPWYSHPRNPIMKDPQIFRQAGRAVISDNRIYRYVQKSISTYGEQVIAFEVLKLTDTEYEEICVKDPVLYPKGAGWNCHGMHHIDPVRVSNDQWVACVDGKKFERWDVTLRYLIKRVLKRR